MENVNLQSVSATPDRDDAASGQPQAGRAMIMVLLVDDQAFVAEAVRRAIAEQPDIDLHFCSAPEKAVRFAQEIRPTVILQDLVMPGTDGLSLVRQYRASPVTQDIPIVVLSTKEDASIKSAAFEAGANDYLVKLPDSIELIARLRYHSRSYINLLQRDEAYRALRQSQQQLLEINLELQRLTHSDGLTGLSNRRYFDEYIGAEWRRAQREQSSLGMLMIDVDSFKLYNDTYGHVAGDEVLKGIGSVLANASGRPSDLAARFGGEEFAMVLPSTTAGGLRLLGEKVRIMIEALHIEHNHSSTGGGHVTISVGGATLVPRVGQEPTTLIEAADSALYRAKHNGKNQVAIFSGV